MKKNKGIDFVVAPEGMEIRSWKPCTRHVEAAPGMYMEAHAKLEENPKNYNPHEWLTDLLCIPG